MGGQQRRVWAALRVIGKVAARRVAAGGCCRHCHRVMHRADGVTRATPMIRRHRMARRCTVALNVQRVARVCLVLALHQLLTCAVQVLNGRGGGGRGVRDRWHLIDRVHLLLHVVVGRLLANQPVRRHLAFAL